MLTIVQRLYFYRYKQSKLRYRIVFVVWPLKDIIYNFLMFSSYGYLNLLYLIPKIEKD